MSDTPPGRPFTKLQVAARIFDSLANMKNMGWGFVRTTCYPKAYMACEHARENGATPNKAWGFEDDKPLTGVHPSGGLFKWFYHVGMSLPVETRRGKVEDLVFDPSLFDGPVRVKEWGDKIGAASHKVGVFSFETPPTSLAGNMPGMSATHSPSMTARAMQKLSEWSSLEPPGQRLVFPSDTMRSLDPVERLPKVGWETHGESGLLLRTQPKIQMPTSRP